MKHHNNAQKNAWVSGTTGLMTMAPATFTKFEQEVARLGLLPADYVGSAELKAWCSRNASIRWIPEYLLKTWGLTTCWDITETKPSKLAPADTEFATMQEIEIA